MTPSEGRMLPVSADITKKLRALRQEQRISAQSLAERLTEAGYPVARSSIASYEVHRADTLPLDYAAMAAVVLGTSLTALLREPLPCSNCKGFPPHGFTCNACGGAA